MFPVTIGFCQIKRSQFRRFSRTLRFLSIVDCMTSGMLGINVIQEKSGAGYPQKLLFLPFIGVYHILFVLVSEDWSLWSDFSKMERRLDLSCLVNFWIQTFWLPLLVVLSFYYSLCPCTKIIH